MESNHNKVVYKIDSLRISCQENICCHPNKKPWLELFRIIGLLYKYLTQNRVLTDILN